jgi:hypothetical protein
VYNFVCFNDGYHVEHHRYPGLSWRTLPAVKEPGAASSAWPAPLRWIEGIVTAGLNFLERIVLSSPPLQRFVLRAHERAFRMVLGVRNAEIAEIAENENHSPRLEYRRAGLCANDEHFLVQRTLRSLRSDAAVAIIGGGLFPRTALVVRRLLPHARITIIDQSGGNLARAGVFLRDHSVTLLHQRYTAPQPPDDTYDIVVFPLAFRGDRNAIYAHPPAPVTIVHDWIWRPRGVSCVVSAALLKRVNLLRR